MANYRKRRNREWFKSSSYMWGWYPSSWQGWAVLSFCILVLLYGSWVLLPFGRLESFDSDSVLTWLLFVVMLVSGLIIVVWETGGSPNHNKKRIDNKSDK